MMTSTTTETEQPLPQLPAKFWLLMPEPPGCPLESDDILPGVCVFSCCYHHSTDSQQDDSPHPLQVPQLSFTSFDNITVWYCPTWPENHKQGRFHRFTWSFWIAQNKVPPVVLPVDRKHIIPGRHLHRHGIKVKMSEILGQWEDVIDLVVRPRSVVHVEYGRDKFHELIFPLEEHGSLVPTATTLLPGLRRE